MGDPGLDLASLLRRACVVRGDLVGLAVTAGGMIAVAPQTAAGRPGWVGTADEVAAVERELRPRWVTWSGETAARLTGLGVRLATCWDIAAVHRLLFGGWRAEPGLAWASLHGLPTDNVPSRRPGELFSTGEPVSGTDETSPVGPNGYLRLEWTEGDWADSPARLVRWARLALETAGLQQAALSGEGADDAAGPMRTAADGPGTHAAGPMRTAADGPGTHAAGPMRATADRQGIHAAEPMRAADGPGTHEAGPMRAAGRAVGTARSESTAELLCVELAADGLPVDRAVAERLLTEIIGPRPRDAAQAAQIRAERDERVLRHAPAGRAADLRSPGQVKTLLSTAGIDVPDTRAWRLEQFKDTHPLVGALLEWRKAERIATTYGYGWLDSCLGADGRLRGQWTGSDGAAGRMTASAGLHNMPAVLRQAVIAADGHVFIRADLGQIEPRVLAAVSGDQALIKATQADDLYLPVAQQLNVDRPTAKVAMIAAMYGGTTGHIGQALRRMKATYPVAMAYLDEADLQAQARRDLRTHGGRLVRMSGGQETAEPESTAQVAGRGRYGRNAMIQGAAAELFKMWAVTVRARGTDLDARIVLCLHDELLVHVPAGSAERAARLVSDCLAETARRWATETRVRFLADISTVRCWADAKPIGRAGTVTASISA
jgi:DNA polymerase-1